MMSFKQLKKRLSSTWQGKAGKSKMDFAFRVHDLMADAGINNAQLSEKMGTSAAYVTKVLRGEQNLSIDSIHKIAHALEAQVTINMARKNFTGRWFEVSNKTNSNKNVRVASPDSSILIKSLKRDLECA
jgi:transcriptional regulator with XRE-family HTH domain